MSIIPILIEMLAVCFKESHQVGLYTANKKQNIRIALLSIEMEKNMGEMAETVLMSDETVLARQTIIDYYNTIDVSYNDLTQFNLIYSLILIN